MAVVSLQTLTKGLIVQRLTVHHLTTYHYREPVQFGEHRLMVRPRDSHDLRVIDASIGIKPTAQLRWLHDVFGNSVAIATFETLGDRLQIDSSIVIDRYPLLEEEFPVEPYAQQLPFSYPASEIPDLTRSIERHYPDPDRLVIEWAHRWMNGAGAPIDTQTFLRVLTECFRNEFTYIERHEPGVQTPTETLELGSGSCRDYAVLMMEAVRSVGLAARFVSGYLYDPSLDGVESDVTGGGATHAWVQVYLPGAGWLEFDPTNGTHGGTNLVPVAVSRAPEQAVPIAGTYAGPPDAFLRMDVDVTVHSISVRQDVA